MLTREGFVVTDMSAQSTLQRSSWKAEAIRRGHLKISGPIPITEDTPLNDEEEKEFEETGMVSPTSHAPDVLDDEDRRPETPLHPQHPPPSIPQERSSLNSHPLDEQLHQRDVWQERQPSRSPPRPSPQVNEMARDSVIEPISYTPQPQTPLRSTPEHGVKAAQKKKRKSGLRNVFRKMFGRKSKDEPEDDELSPRGHSYHHSDPVIFTQSPPREENTPSGPRISELPVEDLKPLHPLGQHLPFPMNVNAPQASPPGEYLTFDIERPDLRRRATLPSVPSAGIQRHSLEEDPGKLSTWNERVDDSPIPSPGIGIALSSPTQAMSPRASKRRSRSVDALHDLAKDHTSIDRRRSAEITYWRQSHASGSIYSRPQTAKTVETIHSVHPQEPTIKEAEDQVMEMSATLVQANDATPSPRQEPAQRTVEPSKTAFNFGLQSSPLDSASSPSDRPDPQYASGKDKNRLSIEDRVAHLEGTFQSLENSIHRISSRAHRQTVILSEAPRNLRSRTGTSSGSTTSDSRLPEYQSSNDTLKSHPESPTLMRPGSSVDDSNKEKVIERLCEALKYERSARKALEQQVLNLRHDIADLHALVNKLIASAAATSPSYPTPSPDTLIIAGTEERMTTPRVSELEKSNASTRKLSDESYTSSREDVSPRDGDVWATPKEEGFGESQFFHERAGRAYA